jgi:chemotaxis protein CheY-P-specific phosphatase CheC
MEITIKLDSEETLALSNCILERERFMAETAADRMDAIKELASAVISGIARSLAEDAMERKKEG